MALYLYGTNIKVACHPCIRGHRSTKCTHTNRVLIRVRKPGRPLSSCVSDDPSDDEIMAVIPTGQARQCLVSTTPAFSTDSNATLSGSPSATAASACFGTLWTPSSVKPSRNAVKSAAMRKQSIKANALSEATRQPVDGNTISTLAQQRKRLKPFGPLVDADNKAAVPECQPCTTLQQPYGLLGFLPIPSTIASHAQFGYLPAPLSRGFLATLGQTQNFHNQSQSQSQSQSENQSLSQSLSQSLYQSLCQSQSQTNYALTTTSLATQDSSDAQAIAIAMYDTIVGNGYF